MKKGIKALIGALILADITDIVAKGQALSLVDYNEHAMLEELGVSSDDAPATTMQCVTEVGDKMSCLPKVRMKAICKVKEMFDGFSGYKYDEPEVKETDNEETED